MQGDMPDRTTWTWTPFMDRARRLTRKRVQRHTLRLTEERREHLGQKNREAKRVRRQQ